MSKQSRRRLARVRTLRAAADIPGQVNPVRDPYQPADNEVWAQLRATPEDFAHDSFQSSDIEPGIREITGTLTATGEAATAAYCFAGPEYDLAAAQEWLAGKEITPAKIEPAKNVTYKQMTAKAAVFCAHGPMRVRAEGGKRLPTMDILVYTGGKVQPAGWPVPMVAECSGIRLDRNQAPVLKDHDPDLVVGHGIPQITASQVRLAGPVSGTGAAAREVLEAAANGFEWQASIGLDRDEAVDEPVKFIGTGETLRANGQTFTGPLIYWPTSLLNHVAITGRGADPKTRVSIAAKAAKPLSSGVRKMDEFELWVKDTLGMEPSTLTGTQKTELRASYNAKQAIATGSADIDRQVAEAKRRLGTELGSEMLRLDKVRACFDKVAMAWSMDRPEHTDKRKLAEELRAKATANEGGAWSSDRIELEFLKLGYPSGVVSNTQGNSDVKQNVLECAAAKTCMMPDDQIAKHWDAATIEAASHPRLRGLGLKGLIFQCARAKGYTGDWIQNEMEADEALRYAFPGPRALRAEASTFQLPGILSNLMNKNLYQGFWEVENVWQQIAVSRPVNDFKPNPSFRLFGNLQYEKIGANGEIPHGDLGEIVYSNAADTYAKGMTTTRQAIINDDLSALSQIPQLFGRGAALTLNYVFWTVFLTAKDSQGKDMFSQARGNLFSGASYALGSTALTTIEQAFNEQTGPDGAPFAMDAEMLLVPPALANVASRLFTSEKLFEAVTGLASTSAKTVDMVPSDNPHVRKYKPVMSRYLGSKLGPKSLGSDNAWYLLGRPGTISYAEIVFLNGQQTPTIQSTDLQGDSLGIYHRAFFDFGVALTEYRNAIKAKTA